MDPKELVMQLIQTLGAEFVIAMLSDDKMLQMVGMFAQEVGKLQPEERQKLVEVVTQLAQQGGGGEQAPTEPDPEAARQQAVYGSGQSQQGF